jgi:hypothetical protein
VSSKARRRVQPAAHRDIAAGGRRDSLPENQPTIDIFKNGHFANFLPLHYSLLSGAFSKMRFWIRLFFSNSGYHRRAFDEVFIITAVSVVPLLLLPFIASAKATAEATFDFSSIIWSAISSGQLYLYSLSVFGNIVWLCVEDWKQEFAPRKYFVVSSILAAFLCLAVYSVDPSLAKPLNPFLIKISIGIYAIYLVMYYTLLVFKMLRAPPITETVDYEVDSLIRTSRGHRGQQQ